jgi:hypothetical protein
VVVGQQQKETENAFVGGQNRWSYDSFVNWEFWWPAFPVLVYFKVGVRVGGGEGRGIARDAAVTSRELLRPGWVGRGGG